MAGEVGGRGVVRGLGVGHAGGMDTSTEEQAAPSQQPGRDVVDLAAVLATFSEPWQPRTVARMNDDDVRVVHTRGEFTRHSHPKTDELFLVLSGSLTIRLDDGDVDLGPGQLYVVPRGVPHQPVSTPGAQVLLLEPRATVNTGDAPGSLTAPRRVVGPDGTAAVDGSGAG